MFDGLSFRVPTIVVSVTDFTFLLKQKTTIEELNGVLEAAANEARYAGVLAVTKEPLVSSDFIGNPYSSIVDLSLTKVVDGDLVKVIAWYDNEWGYSNRLVELASVVSR
jgi:glyceraldehyde 3-phosphate dehydrogenase